MAIEKRFIAKVEFSEEFAYASARLEYGTEKMHKMNFTLGETLLQTVIRLTDHIEDTHTISLYSGDDSPGWGRVKAMDTFEAADGRVAAGIGYYVGFFHGRIIAGKHDPLIIVSFRGKMVDIPIGYDSAWEVAIFHGVSDHKVLFGEGSEKYDEDFMRKKREKISDILNFHAHYPGCDSAAEDHNTQE
ncbi:hypothetical protein J2125_000788 [Erwinia toletana]|uniref:Uncharacterized protein n=1 Tax=Winslowiella toletana TaxID=92490 RepID=A0ABS4P4M4_9GAMM|nr:hypothetical protein [Winslowiella toletana]MBP2167596.1 hypothetical protein [Winslowiella toletana]